MGINFENIDIHVPLNEVPMAFFFLRELGVHHFSNKKFADPKYCTVCD